MPSTPGCLCASGRGQGSCACCLRTAPGPVGETVTAKVHQVGSILFKINFIITQLAMFYLCLRFDHHLTRRTCGTRLEEHKKEDVLLGRQGNVRQTSNTNQP